MLLLDFPFAVMLGQHQCFAAIGLQTSVWHCPKGANDSRMHLQEIATDQLTKPEIGICLDQGIGFCLRGAQMIGAEILVDLKQKQFGIRLAKTGGK